MDGSGGAATCSLNAFFGAGKGCVVTPGKAGGGAGGLSYVSTVSLSFPVSVSPTSPTTFLAVAGG